VNKARAIHVRAIMERGAFEPCEQAVSLDARCEDVLPQFADHQWLGVLDAEGRQIGRISATQVIRALARYSAASA
jgi:glycine betaine/proline transport system ATP-binding protein